jgi:hypothetical protein
MENTDRQQEETNPNDCYGGGRAPGFGRGAHRGHGCDVMVEDNLKLGDTDYIFHIFHR